MASEQDVEFGHFEPTRLEAARMTRSWRLCDLAQKAGISPRTIHSYECGDVVPSKRKVERLAEALEWPVGFFYLERMHGLKGCSMPELDFEFKANLR